MKKLSSAVLVFLLVAQACFATVCPKCSQTPPAGSKFCAQCGIQLPRLCPVCNKQLPKNSKFCPQCGRSLSSVDSGPRTTGPETRPADRSSDVLYPVKVKDRLGYINTKGTMVVPPKFTHARTFAEDVGWASLGGRWGCIDSLGRVVMPCEFDWGGDFSEGLAQVSVKKKYGFIDKQGKFVITPQFDNVESFSEGLAAVETNDQWTYVDQSGKTIVPFRFSEAEPFSEGLAAVKTNGQWGYIDRTGKIVIPANFTKAGDFSDGMAAVQIDGKWGFINRDGSFVVQPQYDSVKPFREGLACVGRGGKHGYIDRTGRLTVPLKYDRAASFSEGLAPVNTGFWKASIPIAHSKEITNVAPKEYQRISNLRNTYQVSAGKWGYIDKTGREVVPLKYKDAQAFVDGIAWVKGSRAWIPIDRSGKELSESGFGKAPSFLNGLGQIDIGKYRGYVNRKGQWIWKPEIPSDEAISIAHSMLSSGHLKSAFRLAVRSAKEQYQTVVPSKDRGRTQWRAYTLNSMGKKFDAIRFVAPAGYTSDLFWAFAEDSSFPRSDSWYIMPAREEADNHLFGFKRYMRTRDVELYDVTLPSKNSLFCQALVGEDTARKLQPGREYIIWFNFTHNTPVQIWIAINVVRSGSETDSSEAITRVLGLRPVSFDDAIGVNAVSRMQEILEANPEIARNSDPHGVTKLHRAAANGSEPIVQALLAKKAPVNAKTSKKLTPLHLAGSPEVCRLLLEKGAKVNAKDESGRTPLHSAALRGNVGVSKILVEKGASIQARDKWGQTPFLLACAKGHAEILEYLVNNGAKHVDRDTAGETPLHNAAYRGHTDTVEYLLEHGAQVDARNKKGQSPLHQAVMQSRYSVVVLLLRRGANPNTFNEEGLTPLHIAANIDSRGIAVDALLRMGADLSARDRKRGAPALHWAAARGMNAAVGVLVKAGADVNAKDDHNKTALHYAMREKHEDIASFLKYHGARE